MSIESNSQRPQTAVMIIYPQMGKNQMVNLARLVRNVICRTGRRRHQARPPRSN